MVESSAYHDMPIQPGMLINVIHKGLQFMDIEAHMNPVRAISSLQTTYPKLIFRLLYRMEN
jgi:hypothetical protein